MVRKTTGDVKLQVKVFCPSQLSCCIYLCTNNITTLLAQHFQKIFSVLLKFRLFAFHTVESKVCSIDKFFSQQQHKTFMLAKGFVC